MENIMANINIDYYMDGYDEGKDDVVEIIDVHAKPKKVRQPYRLVHNKKARSKKAYYKSERRMKLMAACPNGRYVPSPEDEPTKRGILRNHSLPTDDRIVIIKDKTVSTVRRNDAMEQKIHEYAHPDVEDLCPA